MTIQVDIVPRHDAYNKLPELYKPQLANKFLPEWYKKQKYTHLSKSFGTDGTDNFTPKTTKNCPAIRDMITDGIILPAWTDLVIVKNNEEHLWNLSLGNSHTLIETELELIAKHTNSQTEPMELHNIPNYGTLKLTSPYYFRTPKGYGLRFNDPFYHHRRNIRMLPAQVETDKWHEVNFPFEFYRELDTSDRLYVKAGEPLLSIVPYKITDNKITINTNNDVENIREVQSENNVISHSLSSDWYDYKKAKVEEE
jgi:hypothetical protein